jgi:hypothetical protein
MKRILALLIIFCLFALPLHAGVTGSVSLANIRLSLVNGTAFVDFSAVGTLTPYVGQRLTLTDSAGKKAIGYIKAAGTGETLGDELVTNGTFDSDIDGWSLTTNGGTIAWDSGTIKFTEPATSENMYATQSTVTEVGALYKAALEAKVTDSNYSYIRLGTVATTNNNGESTYIGVGTVSLYGVALSTATWYTATFSGGGTRYVNQDNASFKKVLTPSATGATITSTPGGTTYNWASIESGFNYNDASGYTYTIVPRFVGGGLGMGIIYGF